MKATSQRALTAVVLLVGVVASAGTSGPFGNPPRIVPFRGQLALDGNPFSGSVPMTFFFVKASTQTAADQIWSEDYPEGVAIESGQFTVNLGSKTAGTGIPDAVLAEPELYIGMKVNGNELSGLQRFFATPYSINAAQAQNFSVSNNLTVAKNATIGSNLSVVNSLSIGSQLRFPNNTVPAENVVAYDGGGTNRYGLGMKGGALSLFIPPSAGVHVAFSRTDGTDVAEIYGDGHMRVGGSITSQGTGGNVPHGCVVRMADGGAVTCNAGEIAVSGGGSCNGSDKLHDSYPTPLSAGAVPTGWGSGCLVWGNDGGGRTPAKTYAVCCAQ